MEKHNDNLEYLAPLLYLWKQTCPYLSYISVATVELAVYIWYPAMLWAPGTWTWEKSWYKKQKWKRQHCFINVESERPAVFLRRIEKNQGIKQAGGPVSILQPFPKLWPGASLPALAKCKCKVKCSPCSTCSGAVKSPIIFFVQGQSTLVQERRRGRVKRGGIG